MSKNPHRLLSHIKPEKYTLIIKPDLDRFIFKGEEKINLRFKKSSDEIILHAKNLKITDVSLKISNSKVLKPKQITDTKSETVTFTFNSKIPKGKGELSLKFSGILNDKMRGFYRSSYRHLGKIKHMATTQFEATDARQAFPCFDEPAQKAIFDITLLVPKGLTAISNTIESEIKEHESGYKIVRFEPTPKMSTYLVAFIIGDFEFIEGQTKDGVKVRIFVTPGKKHQAKFALDTAIKTLEFFNGYFDIPYPLPVMDLIAIPDFSHGAMENWGAITYRESALLVDSEHSSAANKQWVALVIAHELAHQWFGNLVTMEWWTHLWLNEGFASYIEYLAVDHLFPSWDIWTQFAYNDLNVALELDSLKYTHPIEVPVNHPDEIGEIFDEISYSKGSSVIRMLAGYLGEDKFREGLRYYLKKHSYKNASTIHLWDAFEKVSKKPVKKLMSNWTGKGGYPVVRVVEGKNYLTLMQSRYFSSPISKKNCSDKTVWQIPINVFDSNGNKHNFLLNQAIKKISKPKASWIKFNFGETSYIRTDYPGQMLLNLIQPIKRKQLPAIDRLAIIRDAFALAQAGELPTVSALKLLSAYKNETDYTVWVEIASGLAGLKNILWSEDIYPVFENFAREIFVEAGKKIGWQAKKGERHTQSLLRSLILSQLAAYNHKSTILQGLSIFKKSKIIPANIRSTVYQIVAQQGKPKDHRQFINRYKTETLSEEKNRIGRALGQFRNNLLISKTLDFAMSKEVRIQDTAGIFAAVWSNMPAQDTVWQYTKKHWKELLRRYPSSGHILNRFIKPVSHFKTLKRGREVEQFFKIHKAPGAERTISQTLEKIYSNDLWLIRDKNKIENFLNRNEN